MDFREHIELHQLDAKQTEQFYTDINLFAKIIATYIYNEYITKSETNENNLWFCQTRPKKCPQNE